MRAISSFSLVLSTSTPSSMLMPKVTCLGFRFGVRFSTLMPKVTCRPHPKYPHPTVRNRDTHTTHTFYIYIHIFVLHLYKYYMYINVCVCECTYVAHSPPSAHTTPFCSSLSGSRLRTEYHLCLSLSVYLSLCVIYTHLLAAVVGIKKEEWGSVRRGRLGCYIHTHTRTENTQNIHTFWPR
jgi:hypothetical protein